MRTNKGYQTAVILFLIAIFSFLGCEKLAKKSPTAVDTTTENQPLAKSSLPASLSSTSDIIVNTTSDVADFGGSQQVGDLPGLDGLVSLREAIIAANNTAGPQIIGFNIPTSDPGFDGTVFTIKPLSQPPVLSGGETTINGATQTDFTGNTNPNGPEVVLNGSLISGGADGIPIHSANNVIQSLVINGFPNNPGVCCGMGIDITTAQASGNIVTGCFIGLDASGTVIVGNGDNGVAISRGATNNRIGGTTPEERNVISGNAIAGIQINSGASNNIIQGNFIGTDLSGTNAIGNQFGGVILVDGAASNIIGGLKQGAGNVVSGNPHNAVNLDGAVGNLVQGNFIGTDVTGMTPLPNSFHGVSIGLSASSQNNRIKANIIAHNGLDGVVVGSGISNSITHNRIFSNHDLGINLGTFGVTPNDPGDVDSGPNNLMNFPVLTSAKATPGQLIVKGTIDTPDPKSVTIEFFANPVPTPGGDPSGHGEGAIFLGTKKPNPQGKFTATLPPVAPGTLITATATDADGNTSEFAANIEAKSPGN